MQDGALSANTRRALKADLRIYTAWCADKGRRALPASPDTIAAFVDAMAATRAPTTVRRYVASIAMAHRATGSPEAPKSPKVKLALARMHRDRGRRQAQAPGLTWPLRQRLVEAPGDRLIDVRNRALLAVAYDTMLRRSELAALRLCDLAVDRTGAATVLVRNSKTDAEGEGAVLYIAPDSLALVAEWLERSGVTDGRLFRSLCHGRPGEALDPSQIPRIYKAMARRAGIEPELAERLSGHSTRVGAAQDMVAHGIGLPAIQQAGRWKSTGMVNRYGERLLAGRGGAAQLARMQGRDRPVARRWPPASEGPVAPTAGGVPDRAAQGAHRRQVATRAPQHRARPAAPPPEREPQGRQRAAGQPDRQLERQPDQIRSRRTGRDDRHDMPVAQQTPRLPGSDGTECRWPHARPQAFERTCVETCLQCAGRAGRSGLADPRPVGRGQDVLRLRQELLDLVPMPEHEDAFARPGCRIEYGLSVREAADIACNRTPPALQPGPCTHRQPGGSELPIETGA